MAKRRQSREERLRRIAKSSTKRHELLNMRFKQAFRYDLKEILLRTTIPETEANQFAAQVLARASRQGIDDAKDYIVEKTDEGLVDSASDDQVMHLLDRYSRYR